MHKTIGGCHCGNITFKMETIRNPDSWNPRACDCDFCSKHGASYISDKSGKLIVSIQNKTNFSKYQQGSGIADFLVCKKCGVLIGVCYEEQGLLFSAINSKAVDRDVNFGEDIMISPKELNDDEKTQLWKDFWFSDVKLKYIKV